MNITTFEPNFKNKAQSKLEISSEMLAAILARYSRKGEGMESILSILSRTPTDKFEDAVWGWLDYGHASIGGLTSGIPVGIDKVPMIVPYLSFFVQPKQDGQETSTRYVEFKPEGLAHPSEFDIPTRFHSKWYETMLEGFAINKELSQKLDTLGTSNPELAKIPSDATPKERARMVKNFGFDRARYTIPLAGLTNFGLIMTAREWAQTLQYISSFGQNLPVFNEVGLQTKQELQRNIPRLMKHSGPSDRTTSFANQFLERGVEYLIQNGVNTENVADVVKTEVFVPNLLNSYLDSRQSLEQGLNTSFEGKKTRYDLAKGLAEKIHVAIYWNNMSIAECRDINRQRPCKKDTLLAPIGSYMPQISMDVMNESGLADRYKRFLDRRADLMMNIVRSENPHAYVGCLLLGDQTPFELHTTGDHFAYVVELRTGRGVHFRYDDHVRQAYASIDKQIPELTKHIKLGTGEPE